MTENMFRKFNDLIFQTMHQFYVWRHLQHTENKSAYNARGHFWATVIPTLHQAFLLNLANLFDEKDKRVLSVFTFLDYLKDSSRRQTLLDLIHSPKHENALKRLSQWRNNILAHKNMRFVLNPKELSTKFPFTYEEIESLLELLTEILKQTKRAFDPKNATDYSAYYLMLDDDCQEHTDFVLSNGLHTEAYKKRRKEKE